MLKDKDFLKEQMKRVSRKRNNRGKHETLRWAALLEECVDECVPGSGQEGKVGFVTWTGL